MRDASDISRQLARRIEALVRELLPNGHRQGRDWRVGSIAGEPGESLAVCLAGSRAGLWVDHAGDGRGDALNLVAVVQFRGELAPALNWARRWLGTGTGDVATSTRPAVPPAVDDAAEDEAAIRAALGMFLSAHPSLRDTPADFYLRGREINLAELGRQPRALRFHPALFNVEIRGPMPAMVAAVTDADGRHVATHRTWLAEACGPDGVARWGKAPLRLPRRIKGRLRDGCIRLWRGATGKSLPQAAEGEAVVIAEGIETALSVVVSCPELRVLAATSLGQMAKVALPPAIGTVILAADNDAGNAAALRVLHQAVARFAGEGRQVRIARSSVGSDFNDQLIAGATI